MVVIRDENNKIDLKLIDNDNVVLIGDKREVCSLGENVTRNLNKLDKS